MTQPTPPTQFLLINKRTGMTSFGVVARLRRITNIKKIGHTGTLDPFAEGLLLVGIGRQSTKQITGLVKQNKEYIADLKLGYETETLDPETEEQKIAPEKITELTEEKIEAVLKKFTGEQKQIPPMYSAKKIDGQKLYNLARQGKTVERQPNKITIFSLEMLDFKPQANLLQIKTTCSSGTYIRVLAQDIGRVLNTGAYLTRLVRTKIDEYKIEDSVTLEKLTSDNWQKYTFEI